MVERGIKRGQLATLASRPPKAILLLWPSGQTRVKAVLGADTDGYANGLTRILNTTVRHCGSPMPSVPRLPGSRPSALTGEFGISLWNLLSACAADPSLEDGQQGPLLLAAKGKARLEVEAVREAAGRAKLEEADLGKRRGSAIGGFSVGDGSWGGGRPRAARSRGLGVVRSSIRNERSGLGVWTSLGIVLAW